MSEEIAGQAVRKLTRDADDSMDCPAGICGGVGGMIAKTETASKTLATDRSSLDCARNTPEYPGFREFHHIRVSDMGMEKGESPVTEERLSKAATRGAEKLIPSW